VLLILDDTVNSVLYDNPPLTFGFDSALNFTNDESPTVNSCTVFAVIIVSSLFEYTILAMSFTALPYNFNVTFPTASVKGTIPCDVTVVIGKLGSVYVYGTRLNKLDEMYTFGNLSDLPHILRLGRFIPYFILYGPSQILFVFNVYASLGYYVLLKV
jgi:hypothetical protein